MFNHSDYHQATNKQTLMNTPINAPIAFFDLDLTLLSVNSATPWIKSEYKLGYVSLWQVLKAAFWLTRYHFGASSMEGALRSAIKSLKGQDAQAFQDRMTKFFNEQVKHKVRPGALEQIEEHKSQGHLCYLCTNATDMLARLFVDELELDGMICNGFAVEQGKFSGEPKGTLCFGPGKLILAKQLLQNSSVSLEQCYFYTDSYSDLPLLKEVGQPVVVHPDQKLRKEAQKRTWPIVDWGV